MTVDLQFLATLVINPSSFSNYRENMNDRPAAGLGKIGNPKTTLFCGDVIRPLSAQAGVRSGVDARESAKFILQSGTGRSSRSPAPVRPKAPPHRSAGVPLPTENAGFCTTPSASGLLLRGRP